MARRFRLPHSVEELTEFYLRYVSPISLVGGYLMDNFVLAKRVDVLFTNVLLSTYLIVSAATIILINLIQTGAVRNKRIQKAFPLFSVAVQFCFGGLFSAYLSLYSRSANVSVSWIFVLAITAFLILNERFSHFYARFFVQVSIYFTVLFAYLIFLLPVVFHQVGPWMFAESGLLALSLMTVFLWLLLRIIREPGKWRRAAATVGSIYVVFNVLYFTNAIPPLPLAIRAAGVYHGVTRITGGYALLAESEPWYKQFFNATPVYHRLPGERVYVWTSIFAPTGLNTEVVNLWQQRDSSTGAWVTKGRVGYPIIGGRYAGYGGWSEEGNIDPGEWRVEVFTQSGQLIGRIPFTVVDASSTPQLETVHA